MMGELEDYKVSLEIQLHAESPLDAAKRVQGWLREDDSDWQFYVQKEGKKTVYSVDLAQDDEDAVLEAIYEPLIRL